MPGLTNQQLEFFHTEGYLHVPEALRPYMRGLDRLA